MEALIGGGHWLSFMVVADCDHDIKCLCKISWNISNSKGEQSCWKIIAKMTNDKINDEEGC